MDLTTNPLFFVEIVHFLEKLRTILINFCTIYRDNNVVQDNLNPIYVKMLIYS